MSKPHVLACSDTCCIGLAKVCDETAGNNACAKAAKNKAVLLPCEAEPDTTHGEGTLKSGEATDSGAKVGTTDKVGLRPLHGS